MENSVERITAVIKGEIPDRAPMFDLLRNDKVIEHFSGRRLSAEDVENVVYSAYAPAIDATRPAVKIPRPEESVTLEDGRREERYRWTTWAQHVAYPDSESYALAKRLEMEKADPSAWSSSLQVTLEDSLRRIE